MRMHECQNGHTILPPVHSTFERRLDRCTLPAPPRAGIGDPCPICGAMVEWVVAPWETEIDA